MKINRLNFFPMLFLAIGMALTGCNREKVSDADEPSVSDNPSQIQTAEVMMERDSLTGDTVVPNVALLNKVASLKDNVDSLRTQLNEANVAIDKLNEELEKRDAISGVELLAIGLGSLGLLAALFAIFGYLKLKAKSIQQVEDLKRFRYRLSEIRQEQSAIRPSGSSAVSSGNDMDGRMVKVEKAIIDLHRRIENPPKLEKQRPQQVANHSPVKTVETVSAYFGNPSRGDKEGYFRKELEYRDSDARFIAKIQGSMASFSPIIDSEAAKKTLISSDQMKLAVEFTGCAPSDMQTMTVTSGIALRQPGGRWLITQKSKVELK